MATECRACLNKISNEFTHLAANFSEEQTYFESFNECTQLQTTFDDNFSQVLCQTCVHTLHIVFDFIKIAQKSDLIIRSRLDNKTTSVAESPKSEIFKEADIESMEIVVLETLNDEVLKEEETLTDYNWAISDDDGYQNFNFTCQECHIFFGTQTQLVQHLLDAHNEVDSNSGFVLLATCETCQKTFESNEILDLHMLIFHQSTFITNCALCNVTMKTDFEDISKHFHKEHPLEYEKLFKNIDDDVTSPNDDYELVENCRTDEDCDATSDDCNEDVPQINAEKHSHTNNLKQFLCSFCPREFKNQKSLRHHEKIHFETAEGATHICSDCNRQYNTATLLEQHRKNAHKLREYVCNICGNAFKLRNQLNNHMKLHLEKNISCPHCDKKYSRRFDLNIHLRSHTGEMPYECHLCEKKFAIKVRLTYHLQKHYGIKHQCKECGAEFNSKPKLKAHSFKHTGMPYRCELCDDRGFPNRDVFKRHLLRLHNATITEENLLDMFQRNTGKSTRIREVNALSK